MGASDPRITDQTGRTFVVTGGNSGLGFETAKALAAAGAHVVLACRNRQRAEDAAARIDGSTEVRELDTSSLASVRAFAESTTGPVDVLVNNAGTTTAQRGARTVDGFEPILAANYLGAFALTALLLPRIVDRVVMTSSIAHRAGDLHLDDPDWHRSGASGAYARSKLADLMFAYELQHRFVAASSRLRSMAAHPGLAATELGPSGDGLRARTFRAMVLTVGQDQRRGALPTIFAATDPDLPGGTYVGPAGFLELQGQPVPVGSSRRSHDRDLQRILVTASERVTGVALEIPR